VTTSKAWLTVRTRPVGPSETTDAAAIFAKAVTTSDVPGTGHIENDGTGDVDPVVRFDLSQANTRAIGTGPKYFDVQVLTSGDKIYTAESGRIYAGAPEVTRSNS
jgi:hypothetical protein